MQMSFASSKAALLPIFRAARWRLRRMYAQHALQVRAAALGVVGALLLGVFEVRPQWQTLQALRAQPELTSTGAQDNLPARETLALAYVATHARQPIAIPTVLNALSAVAAQHGVRIESVEQAPRPLRELPVRVMTLNTTVSGSYPALRAFMADALRKQPQLGLESWSVGVTQESARTVRAVVGAELRWVVLAWEGQPLTLTYSAEAPRVSAVSGAVLRDLFGGQGGGKDGGQSMATSASRPATPLVVAPPPAPRPAAPDVIYLGRMALDGAQQAMVEMGGQSLLLKVGDGLAGGYRIAAFDDEGLTLTPVGGGESLRVMRGQGGK